MTELDRLIAMLEPNADENTVLEVRHQLGKMLHGAYTNDYVPRNRFDDETYEPEEQSEVQSVDVWNPNDPSNW